MSALAKMLCGLTEMTTVGDVAPVECGAPVLANPATAAKRKMPADKKKKDMRGRMASRLIGEDSRDGFVIPDNAKEVDTLEVNGDGLSTIKTPVIPGEKPKNPYSGDEPLILPAASLVAPDVTPEALYPLDPSQLPGADAGKSPESTPMQPAATPPPSPGAAPLPSSPAGSPAIDVVLGKTTGGEPSLESILARMPGIPSPASVAALESNAPSGEAALAKGAPMPEHKGSADGAWKAFLKLSPIPRNSVNG